MKVRGVEVIHWNPLRRLRRAGFGSSIPLGGRINNFGDLLGPELVRRLAPADGRGSGRRLLAVGSILHFAQDGDVVWGTGINGKVPAEFFVAKDLEVHAVRGPRTAAFLEQRGIGSPSVFGDPGLLIPDVLGITRSDRPTYGITTLPNLRDRRLWRGQPGYLDPTTAVTAVAKRLSESELVVTSSLHGIVISEALGVPVAFVLPREESLFKYEDYFEGTGRSLPVVHPSPEAARRNPQFAENLAWTADSLLDAFPTELWRSVQKNGS